MTNLTQIYSKAILAFAIFAFIAPQIALAGPKNLTVTSSSFTEGGSIPIDYSCVANNDGVFRSPQISWSKVPKKTQSIAIVLSDLDANQEETTTGEFFHMGLYNIPAKKKSLPENKLLGQKTINDAGEKGYYFLCPPINEFHNYKFTVYALNTKLSIPKNTSAGQLSFDLNKKFKKNVVAKGTISGLFGLSSDSISDSDTCLLAGGSWSCSTMSGVTTCKCNG